MAVLDSTSFASFLKVQYPPHKIQEMVYKNNPLLAMLSKMEKFGGKNLPVPILFGNPTGRSKTFSSAISNQNPSQVKDFVLTRSQDFAVASIDVQTLKASEGDAYAFASAVTTEMDGAINQLSRAIAIDLYRSGSGSRGQLSASTTLASTTLPLRQPEDVTNFEKGMVIVLSGTDGGGTVRAGSLTITGIDRDTGVLTVDQNISTAIPAATVNDFIFAIGDYDLAIKGLLAWLPSTAPTAGDNFFTVDRSADVSRLAGIRYDGSAQPIEEAIIGAINRVSREGGSPTHCFMNFKRWNELVLSLGSKVNYIEEAVKTGDAYINFRAVMVHAPKGVVKVIADQNCPNDRAFLLQLDTWKLYSLDKVPHIEDSDGLKMLRLSSSNAVEIRVAYYAQLGCNAPGYNANIKLA